MSEHQLYIQGIEILSVAPGQTQSGEQTVVLTIRPDPAKNFKLMGSIALSRSQAIRLMKNLRTVLRQSAGVFLLGLSLASVAGCSVKVVTSETGPAVADAPPTVPQEKKTAVAVSLLQRTEPSPAVERLPVKEPTAAPAPKPAEEVGRTASPTIVIVENRLQVHEHVHVHEAPRSEHVEIEIRRYGGESDEECERLHRKYEARVRELKRLFNQ